MTDILLLAKRDARTDPPADYLPVISDRLHVIYRDSSKPPAFRWRYAENPGFIVDPDPVWYVDLRLSDSAPVTAADLTAAVNAVAVLSRQVERVGFSYNHTLTGVEPIGADDETPAGLDAIHARLRAALAHLESEP